VVVFSQQIDHLHFCDFGLYLDCIKVYLHFNYNYNLVLIEKNIYIYCFN